MSTNVFDQFHPISKIIFNLIANSKNVLDVGCGTGKLGEKLRSNKECFVIGIEVDETKAELAKMRLDRVLIANIEKMQKYPFNENFFDFILFVDILEHLINPELILKKFKKFLKLNGYVIISLPNIANWKMRLNLLFGKWDYKERGLLDKTHLRFFTLKTARKMIQRCGYKIIYLTSTSGYSPIDWKLPFKSPSNIWKSLLACNLIFCAKKSG